MSDTLAEGGWALAAGSLTVLLALLLRGRATRPWWRARAERAALARRPRELRRAADMAIATARRAAGPGEPALVRVAAVREVAVSHFGHRHVSHPEAAAALRARYERSGCARDCFTDAYDTT
ncbi:MULTISPECIES: hypothetical protein [Streptomyces]|uniref:Uncharacterized protein n=3 Tax=Streptomyces diastaticus group TaxID=2849069 RepID=A0A8H9HU35_9ACTN|nr:MULTISPECIES: hypothetical protein [Streptomyces]MDQ0296736.1 uncharacterized protein YceH (UPF0502 family) [Streptomyces sp. DSM 41037]QNE80387.1 hypothetical protein F0345_04055 [Streptomyces rutgersensis]WSU38646.1 hypothetical protein OG378_24190 [Streptomyces gougerotii]GFH76330.1 hypothetical protein Sgou_10000 [Streptomyces gougerotii]GGU78525.1 hypothetical protein GCM10010227_35660 [Streptomyces gougerotii]